MRKQQNQPDVISYNSAISACDKSGEWQAALHLFPDGPDGTWGGVKNPSVVMAMESSGPKNLRSLGVCSMTTPGIVKKLETYPAGGRYQTMRSKEPYMFVGCFLFFLIPLATKICSGHRKARKLDDSNSCNDEDLNLMRGLTDSERSCIF